MDIIDIAIKILEQGPICDHCLGRQFAKLSTGLTNKERGTAIRIVVTMLADQKSKEGDVSLQKMLESHAGRRCWVCNGFFGDLDIWAKRAMKSLSDYQYDTFLVGTRMSGLLVENEEILWAESGTTHAEPLKSELNREVGKLIQSKTGKEVDFERPDIVVMLDIAENKVELNISPIFIYGRYRKLVRGVPQTVWKMYATSVEELIKPPVIRISQGTDMVFHGAGREDIDALMLGSGRPFVVEVKQPRRRYFDLVHLEGEISKGAEGKIEVSDLKFVDKDTVEEIKTDIADKVYRLRVTFEDAVSLEKLKVALDKLGGSIIKQRTPMRVAHRRADKVRKRKVYSVELEEVSGNTATIRVHCEGGLYIKELISGDEGRTRPSLSKLLGVDAKVVELNVIEIRNKSEDLHAKVTWSKEKKQI
jgi:tRNA pseudouridine synthase 10